MSKLPLMSGRVADLSAIGMPLVTSQTEEGAYTEFHRIARRIKASHRKFIGLLPTNSDVGALPFAVQLGFALTQVATGTVCVIDANTRYPGLTPLLPDAEADADAQGFATVWLADALLALTPRQGSYERIQMQLLERTIYEECEGYVHVLCDLTGFAEAGEHHAAIEMLDGVLVVGQAGGSTDGEVLQLMRKVSASRRLGMVLVG